MFVSLSSQKFRLISSNVARWSRKRPFLRSERVKALSSSRYVPLRAPWTPAEWLCPPRSRPWPQRRAPRVASRIAAPPHRDQKPKRSAASYGSGIYSRERVASLSSRLKLCKRSRAEERQEAGLLGHPPFPAGRKQTEQINLNRWAAELRLLQEEIPAPV